MKETKVYVDELPESCFDCHCAHYGGCVIDTGNVEDFEDFDWSERRAKHCPLIDIKTHDREVVKEVCEKIREFCENNKYRCNKYFLLYSIGLNVKLLNKNKEGQKETFYEFLD